MVAQIAGNGAFFEDIASRRIYLFLTGSHKQQKNKNKKERKTILHNLNPFCTPDKTRTYTPKGTRS